MDYKLMSVQHAAVKCNYSLQFNFVVPPQAKKEFDNKDWIRLNSKRQGNFNSWEGCGNSNFITVEDREHSTVEEMTLNLKGLQYIMAKISYRTHEDVTKENGIVFVFELCDEYNNNIVLFPSFIYHDRSYVPLFYPLISDRIDRSKYMKEVDGRSDDCRKEFMFKCREFTTQHRFSERSNDVVYAGHIQGPIKLLNYKAYKGTKLEEVLPNEVTEKSHQEYLDKCVWCFSNVLSNRKKETNLIDKTRKRRKCRF